MYVEPVSYNLNQLVFQEGQKADFVIFIRTGTFELTRQFTKENDCFLNAKKSLGLLELDRQTVKRGEKLEKVTIKNDQSNVNVVTNCKDN